VIGETLTPPFLSSRKPISVGMTTIPAVHRSPFTTPYSVSYSSLVRRNTHTLDKLSHVSLDYVTNELFILFRECLVHEKRNYTFWLGRDPL
jgi:hypothetical protein